MHTAFLRPRPIEEGKVSSYHTEGNNGCCVAWELNDRAQTSSTTLLFEAILTDAHYQQFLKQLFGYKKVCTMKPAFTHFHLRWCFVTQLLVCYFKQSASFLHMNTEDEEPQGFCTQPYRSTYTGRRNTKSFSHFQGCYRMMQLRGCVHRDSYINNKDKAWKVQEFHLQLLIR